MFRILWASAVVAILAIAIAFCACELLSKLKQLHLATNGSWSPVFALPNVPIHLHVLPSGKVLFWGRRDRPEDSLDVLQTTPQIWDPKTGLCEAIPQPTLPNQTKVNIFCSGHTFLSDGRLFVAGGHITDYDGLNQACTYDYASNKWSPLQLMNAGRWYPTLTALPNGSILATSGKYVPKGSKQDIVNNIPQIWNNGSWSSCAEFDVLQLYPYLHLISDGRIFMTGPQATSYYLDYRQGGNWTQLAQGAQGQRQGTYRDYASSVAYDTDKIVFIGGGNDPIDFKPSANCETIDLSKPNPTWQKTSPMHFGRRQHNATLLPDGTVLVTGGTSGSGSHNHFNDLTPGAPVHAAELWNPLKGDWKVLASESVDRCYHSAAVLLPDGRVLSGGGGEYKPDGSNPNNPKDTHRDAQIFSPPYLFKGPRPEIIKVPDQISLGQTFTLETDNPSQTSQVTLIRLPSVTHSFNQNQGVNFLKFKVDMTKLSVALPPSANKCPPGYYMLFVLNNQNVPSIAKIVRVLGPLQKNGLDQARLETISDPLVALNRKIGDLETENKGTRVAVGLTPSCPYGLGTCWPGAFDALKHLEDVGWVRPVADSAKWTGEVYLRKHNGIPNLKLWRAQFKHLTNGSYTLRGVEVTLSGTIQINKGTARLSLANGERKVLLAPLTKSNKIQWNPPSSREESVSEAEKNSLTELLNVASNKLLDITGPLGGSEEEPVIYVRNFKLHG